jgi:hypothetical protein
VALQCRALEQVRRSLIEQIYSIPELDTDIHTFTEDSNCTIEKSCWKLQDEMLINPIVRAAM